MANVPDVRIPTYYLLNRATAREFIDEITRALWITPCVAAIISNHTDAGLGEMFAPTVLFAEDATASMALAKELAAKTGRPVLVIGAGEPEEKDELLVAVYEDDSREQVSIHRRANEERQET
jgi:hypothetical protein